MLYIKIHNAYRKVVALCDEELIGKKFEEGIKQIELRENFYKGEKYDEEKIIELLIKYKKEDATFNIVGEKAIRAALKAGAISKNGIGKIANIPHALVLL